MPSWRPCWPCWRPASRPSAAGRPWSTACGCWYCSSWSRRRSSACRCLAGRRTGPGRAGGCSCSPQRRGAPTREEGRSAGPSAESCRPNARLTSRPGPGRAPRPRIERPAARSPRGRSRTASSIWKPVVLTFWLVGSGRGWFWRAAAHPGDFRRLLRFARPAPAAVQEERRQPGAATGAAALLRGVAAAGSVSPMLWAWSAHATAAAGRVASDWMSAQRATLLGARAGPPSPPRSLGCAGLGSSWPTACTGGIRSSGTRRRELREAEEQCCDAWVVSALPRCGASVCDRPTRNGRLLIRGSTSGALPPVASGIGQVTYPEDGD